MGSLHNIHKLHLEDTSSHESLNALLYVGNRPLGQEPQDFKKQIQGMNVIVLLCAVLIYTVHIF